MSYKFEDMFEKDFVLSRPTKSGHYFYYVNAVGESEIERNKKTWELFEESYSENYAPSIFVEVRNGTPAINVYPGSKVNLLPEANSVILEYFRKEFGDKLS